jgi:hypothetical protein
MIKFYQHLLQVGMMSEEERAMVAQAAASAASLQPAVAQVRCVVCGMAGMRYPCVLWQQRRKASCGWR